MTTITLSPLRRAIAAGQLPAQPSRSQRRNPWRDQIPLGANVYDVQDPRHVGRLTAIMWNTIYVVTWDNGWKSHIPVNRIRKED